MNYSNKKKCSFQVMDYASRLDREEATREYMDAARRELRKIGGHFYVRKRAA